MQSRPTWWRMDKKEYRLEHVVVIGNSGRVSVSTTTDATDIEDENGASLIGTQVPDVQLINQDGKKIRLSDSKAGPS